jgi:hypothetical protein
MKISPLYVIIDNALKEIFRVHQTSHLMFKFFFEIHAVCEVTWESKVATQKPQTNNITRR